MVHRILQINVTANWGSHGKIADDIGNLAIKHGWESAIAYGRNFNPSSSKLIKIGNKWDNIVHGVSTRLFDRHGLQSYHATKRFISKAEEYNPDIIHLHNIHGYYLNYPLLFEWLKRINRPVVWTLHDCWPWTGHCAYYTYNQCYKWEHNCNKCPGLSSYPKSFIDGSTINFGIKKKSFLGVDNLVLVPVSNWLAKDVKKSFLRDYKVEIIHNGIDLNSFHPETKGINKISIPSKNKKIILGVASVWEKRKGLEEFINLRSILPQTHEIVLVGLTPKQIQSLPNGIIGITRTNSVQDLTKLYSSADVFVNPTLEDNFPTTNIEALACGTPVVTYNTGGSPEAIDEKTGFVVPYKDINALKEKIIYICENHPFSSADCRTRAVNNFNKDVAFSKYIELYKSLLSS